MMKLVTFCMAVASFVVGNNAMLSDAQKLMIKGKFLAGGVSCLKDHPLSLSDLKTLRGKQLPNNEGAKCFVECLFKKIGILDDMGKITTEGVKKQAMQIFSNNEESVKKVDQFFEACSSVNQQDISEAGIKACDRSKLVFNCLVENAPKFGFDIDF